MYSISGDKGPSPHETKISMYFEPGQYQGIHTQHPFNKKGDYLSPRLPLFLLSIPLSFHLLTYFPPGALIPKTDKFLLSRRVMSLTPLYPQGLAFRLKAVVGNRQEDVTKVEELAAKRLLAALVASLDMKVCLACPEFVVSESRLTLLLCFYFAAAGPWF